MWLTDSQIQNGSDRGKGRLNLSSMSPRRQKDLLAEELVSAWSGVQRWGDINFRCLPVSRLHGPVGRKDFLGPSLADSASSGLSAKYIPHLSARRSDSTLSGGSYSKNANQTPISWLLTWMIQSQSHPVLLFNHKG